MPIEKVNSKEELAEKYLACKQFAKSVEAASKAAGVEPRQYELLLAVSQWPKPDPPTVRNVSKSLRIRHNTTVELIDRTAQRGAIARVRDQGDRRQVFLTLTPVGEQILAHVANIVVGREVSDVAAVQETAPVPAMDSASLSEPLSLAATA
jgi:DNA-binding MarR family transcriptional regulator